MWIEGDAGLVLIDTEFLASEANAFVDAAERATGKKAVLAIVLHANPDKFNGTATLQARGIRVVTSSAVAALIPEVHSKRLRAFGARYAPDYPTAEPRHEVLADDVVQLEAAGLSLVLHRVGAGCSEAHLVVQHNESVFAGDLIANGAHSWLEIGKPAAWLARIRELRALSPVHVFPGRGLGGGVALLDAEEAYLQDVVCVVDAARAQDPGEAGMARAKAELTKKYAALRFPVFLEIGIPALWRAPPSTTACAN